MRRLGYDKVFVTMEAAQVTPKPMSPPSQDSEFIFIEVKQTKRSFILTAIPVRLLAAISYAAVRRKDEEEGAVQRVLNQPRIAEIKNFALQGGDFPVSIVLNWVGGRLERHDQLVTIPDRPRSAQLLDGQHRVAGLQEAARERPELGKQLVPVAIYEGLGTQDCADIFVSINTEQRPAPRSLVFDLYGIVSEERRDPAIVRATDIAMFLNEQGRPYEGLIKLPNSPRQRGGIALSTAVTAIKDLIDRNGLLDTIGLDSLESQKAVFQNYFSVLAERYGDQWAERDNAFLYAAGFIGALDFLKLKIIPHCNLKKSFTTQTISAALSMEKPDLIKQVEVKGLGGKDAPGKIYERLVEMFSPEQGTPPAFEI